MSCRRQVQGAGNLFGQPSFSEKGVRTSLEATLRSLARFSRDANDKIALVDRANAVRPKSLV
ncbi:MAG: hypothetical protein IPL73_06710 [Candidatus Obscuribacter sp.]|nr:hypothetical protein [Candidatus Obscuribacter sp.]